MGPMEATVPRRWLLVAVAVMAATGGLAACGSPAPSASSSSSTSGSTGPDAAGTVWLCRPGQAHDPCTADLSTTVTAANGGKTTVHPRAATDPPVDCFYVYPTVSRQPTTNADLTIDPEETGVARDQASPFSQACRVYAPMYRQLTLLAIGSGGKLLSQQGAATAYLSLLSAWKDYLAHDNHGRGVVLIGHSQGASMLIALIRSQIDKDPTERRLLVSALLMGGNVTVPVGQTVGGDFENVPACQSNGQTGCVVAYSSFETPPPADSFFGRIGTSIGAKLQSPATGAGDLQVLCTNPAALPGGTGSLDPYFLNVSVGASGESGAGSAAPTPWVAYPGRYTATCMSTGGATWLQVEPTPDPPDGRPSVTEALGPRWGLHLVDVNLALGNLVRMVQDQSAAYGRSG